MLNLERLRRLGSGLLAPWRSVRLAMAALYAGLFLVSGAVLLVVTAELVVHSTAVAGSASAPAVRPAGLCGAACAGGGRAVVVQHRSVGARQLLISSAIGLGAMSLAAIGLGWILAGRVLRPVRAMTAATRQISATNLHRRLTATGPQDEVKDLADTIDDLLGRLETAFDAQRHFVANAAHELRTPVTLQRAMLEVALADPGASLDTLRATCQELLAANADQERLIEALLTLSTSERGLQRRDPLNLSAMARRVADALGHAAEQRGLRLRARLLPARASGNEELVERLIANLLDNALRYNVPAGWVELETGETAAAATLAVRNAGPLVPEDEVQRLFRPFERLARERLGTTPGHGLGLSIVQAVALAHGAVLSVRPLPTGGLDVRVTFPRPRPT